MARLRSHHGWTLKWIGHGGRDYSGGSLLPLTTSYGHAYTSRTRTCSYSQNQPASAARLGSDGSRAKTGV